MPSDHLTKFVFRSRMPAPADAVYRWHAAAGAFERLRPPWEKAHVLESTGGIEDLGSFVTIRFSIGPFTKDWVAEHHACEPGKMFATALPRKHLPVPQKSAKMKAAMSQAKRIDLQLLQSYRSQSGKTIHVLSLDRPLLLVFLRHFG